MSRVLLLVEAQTERGIAVACRRQSRMLGDDPQERELLDFIETATDTESWE
ncbi:MAG TPA: DUF3018 family protein [Aminobacteriaceae bacterium]|nr:DUF3018 family protein [Aminobacteriaceae bacterium]